MDDRKFQEMHDLLIITNENVYAIREHLAKLNGRTEKVEEKSGKHETRISILEKQPSAWKVITIMIAILGAFLTLDKLIL